MRMRVYDKQPTEMFLLTLFVTIIIGFVVVCFTVNAAYFKTFTCTIFLLNLTRTYGIVDS